MEYVDVSFHEDATDFSSRPVMLMLKSMSGKIIFHPYFMSFSTSSSPGTGSREKVLHVKSLCRFINM